MIFSCVDEFLYFLHLEFLPGQVFLDVVKTILNLLFDFFLALLLDHPIRNCISYLPRGSLSFSVVLDVSYLFSHQTYLLLKLVLRNKLSLS
jgi:hypothetical protein